MNIQFSQKLMCQPWDMSPERARTTLAAMLHKLREERPAEDRWGDPLPTMVIEGDVARIPICGTLILNVPQWAKEWGLSVTDPNDIVEELDRAEYDPRVNVVALDWNSGGGESVAGYKIHDRVKAMTKPVLSWAPDGAMICSAAFNGALPSGKIITGPYATVGSVGTYLAYLDDTEWWKMMGITVEVFRSGEFKAIGEDALSESQREYLQSIVDRRGARFRENVKTWRAIDDEHLQGQWFDGQDGVELGFVDAVAPDLSTALKMFRGV